MTYVWFAVYSFTVMPWVYCTAKLAVTETRRDRRYRLGFVVSSVMLVAAAGAVGVFVSWDRLVPSVLITAAATAGVVRRGTKER